MNAVNRNQRQRRHPAATDGVVPEFERRAAPGTCSLKLLAALLLIVLASPASADPPVTGRRILLMKTGRVLEGDIRPISNGWVVSTGTGRLIIPFEQVCFEAEDLNAAYLRLRVETRNPTVASHLQLAEWCLSQRLHEEAATELRDALAKDSANETARLMLNRVEDEMQRSRGAVANGETASRTGRVEVSIEETPAANVRSLAGLSPESARSFVETIQPILSNKCGNARCHGGTSPTEFKLQRIRSGAGKNRISVEMNLAATLQQILPESPETSPLLTIGTRAHAGQTTFSDRYGPAQIAALQEWVRTAARELAPPQKRPQSILASTAPPVLLSVPDRENAASEAPIAEPGSVGSESVELSPDETAAEPGTTPEPLSSFQRILENARSNIRAADPFDPEQFNQRFAGRQTSE